MQFEQCSLDEVAEAVSFLDAGTDRDSWIQIGMAIKSEFGEAGRDVFEDWSRSSDKYKRGDFAAAWKSIKQGGGVRIGTLFKLAMDAGYKPERREWSDEEKRKRQQEYEARRVQREKEAIEEQKRLAHLQGQIAMVCQSAWESDFLAEQGESEYLNKKQVGAFGGRFVVRSFMIVVDIEKNICYAKHERDEMLAIAKLKNEKPDSISFQWLKRGDFVLPMFDMAGKLWALQFIKPTGKKLFIKNSKKSGTCFLIGRVEQGSGPICCAEGFATGATIHMATGFPVFCCWDAGNLVAMVPQIHKALPDQVMLVCGDNDTGADKNTGLEKAKAAAASVGCRFVVPEFSQVMSEIKEVAHG